jgi:hypothetical protein
MKEQVQLLVWRRTLQDVCAIIVLNSKACGEWLPGFSMLAEMCWAKDSNRGLKGRCPRGLNPGRFHILL